MSEVADMHMMMNYVRGVYKVLEEDWQKSAKALGLTQAEQHILWIVSFEQEATISRIAQLGLWDVSTVMQVIKRLKEKGLVQMLKKDHDRRISYVSLTEEGAKKQEMSAEGKIQFMNICGHGGSRKIKRSFCFSWAGYIKK